MSEIKFIQTTPQELNELIRNAVRDEIKNLPQEEERKEAYTKKEVKDLFKTTFPTLDRWNKLGYLKSFKIHGRVYYNAKEIHEKLESKKK